MAIAAPFTWGAGGSRMTPEQIAGQRKVAEAMLAKGGDYTPVQHWTQGAARVSQALFGAMMGRDAQEADKANRAEDKATLEGLLGGGTPGIVPSNPAPALPGGMPPIAPTSSTSQPMGNVAIPAGKEEFVSTVMPLAVEASKKTGVDPRIIVAQAALESNWGKSAPGNNLFGIKSHGQPGGNVLPTTEVVNGQPVRTTSSFRAYANPAESVSGYADFITQNPRYKPLREAQGMDAQIAALGQSGYATDPQYGTKVAQIARGLPGGAPAEAAPAQAGGLQGVSPGIISAITSPYTSEGTKAIAKLLLQQRLQGDTVSTVDLGNAVGVMDKRGNIVRQIPKGEPNKGPEFGVIGKDEFGNEQYGWRDPRTQTTKPNAPQQTAPSAGIAAAAPNSATIPPVPPGMNPKIWRDEQTRIAADAAGGKLTEVQANSTTFANRMEDAERNLATVEPDIAAGGLGVNADRILRGVTEGQYNPIPRGLTNWAVSDKYQKFEQSKSQFITAMLRRESGAAIAESEFARYDKEFFPQMGDSADVIKQKQQARKVAIEGMKKGAGPGYTPPAAPKPTGNAPNGVDPKVWAAMTPEERALWK